MVRPESRRTRIETTTTRIDQNRHRIATRPESTESIPLVSKTPLPEGDGYNVVVQIKAKPDAKPKNFRIKYDTGTCGECKRPQYACTCGH